MVFSSLGTALVAAALASTAMTQQIPTPTASVALNAMTYQGCFTSSDPLVDHGPYTFQSRGNCQPICVLLQMPVMALVNGSNCYCGPLLPAAADKVDRSECNTPCNGFDPQTCGGNNRWEVYLDGLNKNSIANYDPAAPTGAAKTTKAAAGVVTVGGSTVVMTIGPTSGTSAGSGGPSKAGIAAGVVVGVVSLAGIIGGVFLFLRQRKRKQAEEDYKRAAAINEFVGKPPATSHSSLTDTRLDPEIMMRRQSDGSIADNHDYSRRILQVRNPDGSH